MPTLSIITPVYNGEDFINRCYRNLLDQSYKDWEWIVINDGSTDGTADEVRKIRDLRVSFFSYPRNMGRGYARQRALSECSGEWIVIWDVDDLYFPDRLERIDNARKSGYDFFCSYAVLCTNELDIKGIRGFFPAAHGLPKAFVHPSMACRLDIARNIGYDASVRTGEDAEILWILPANYRGLWCESALLIYQEDREVNLQKAIDCNKGHLRLLTKIFRNGALKLETADYICLSLWYILKLVLLGLVRIKPDIYKYSVAMRERGDVNAEYSLSDAQVSYIHSYRRLIDEERPAMDDGIN